MLLSAVQNVQPLRKHVTTISQVLNLKENELDIDLLAQFMGHDITQFTVNFIVFH